MKLLHFTNKIPDSELAEIEARADTQIKIDTIDFLKELKK